MSPMPCHRVLIPAKRIAYDTTAASRIATLLKNETPEYREIALERARTDAPDLWEMVGHRKAAELTKLVKLAPDTIIRGEQPPHASAIVLLGDVNPAPLLSCLGGTVVGPQ